MDDDHTADGWVVVHDRSALPPSEYENLYVLGPLPSKELAEVLETRMTCDCRRMVVPIFFPPGIQMMLVVPESVLEGRQDGPVH
jgi:hypothetical protein